jgi:HAE1 family hydrophobic/amphiphilic exporter-1
MKPLRWILKHPVSIIISVFLIVMIGINSFLHIPLEINPVSQGGLTQDRYKKIQISAHWHKHTPEIIKKVLTGPIEEKCMQIPNISSISSSTGYGAAYITVEFPKEVDEKYVYVNIREKLAQFRREANLPGDVQISVDLIYESEEENQNNRTPFFEIEINGPLSLNELRLIAKRIAAFDMKSVEGVARSEIYGGSDGFIRIEVDREKMEKYQIRIDEIQQKLSDSFYYQSMGTVQEKNNVSLLLFDNRPSSIQDLNKISIANGLILKDIAAISFDYEKPTTIARRNYMPLVTLRIYKIPGVNALNFSKSVQERLLEIERSLPENIDLIVTSDKSEQLREELKSMWIRSAIILTVVFIILLLLFKQLFPSIIILLVIFLSFCTACIFLYFSGYTINIITLAGIALIFGMLVDNAVIVVENLQHYLKIGKTPYISALRGTLEIFKPLLASSATTILVFFSLLLLEDRLGSYYEPMAYVLGFSLFTSLILAIVLIPAIFVRFPDRFRSKETKVWKRKERNYYQKTLKFLLGHPIPVAVLSIILFVGTWIWFNSKVNKGGFFYYRAQDLSTKIYVAAPKGVQIETLDKIAGTFESTVSENCSQCEVKTNINESGGFLTIDIQYPEELRNTSVPYRTEAKLIGQATDYAGVSISIRGMFPEPYYNGGYKIYTNYDTRFKITGPDYDKLWKLGEEIIGMAKQDPRVGETIITPSARNLWSMNSGLHNYQYECDIKKLWNNGISIDHMMNGLYQLFPESYWEDELLINNRKLPVKLSYCTELQEKGAIENSDLSLPGNPNIYFRDYIHPVKEKQIEWIDKRDQQYMFTVAWEYRGAYQQKEAHIKKIVESINMPAGYKIKQHEYFFFTQKEKKELYRLMVIAGIGVFMILAALYESLWQPFVIFLSIPFSLIGVFVMYIAFDRTFNANAYIGIVLLLGIVVNDAIVLVERINQLSEKNSNLKEILLRASRERIRPIMITTVSTIGGLIPIFFLSSRNTELSKILEELSFIMVGGMVSSTLFTISLIPVFYYLIKKAICWVKVQI